MYTQLRKGSLARYNMEDNDLGQIFRKMMKHLKITLLVLLFFLEILKKKKALKKSSEKKL